MSTSVQKGEEESEDFSQTSIPITVPFRQLKDDKLSEICSTVCALINNDGGVMTLLAERDEVIDNTTANNLERRIHQKFTELLGVSCVHDAIVRTSLGAREMVFQVTGISCLCTMHYNIYVPTETQTVPLQLTEDVKMILRPKRIIELDNLVQADDYRKDLVSGTPLFDDPLCLETKTAEYKFVASKKAKRTTLGDRMIHNKFPSYVSAFGNHRGGHIYYGVDDNGVIRGEIVENEDKITTKVGKAMEKVIWPSDDDINVKPVKGQHWDIFFEPVKDKQGQIIKNTFVIVVYVSFCNGGVFAQAPESYHIEQGKVVRMPFREWKKRFVQKTSTLNVGIARSNFMTTKSQNTYYSNMEIMMHLRNQGDKLKFKNCIKFLNEKYKTKDVKISTLSQEATYAFRTGNIPLAEKHMEEYDRLHPQCTENILVSGCMGLYIKSAYKRTVGEYKEAYELAMYGLQMSGGLAPGLIQAWFHTHTAMLAVILASNETNPKRRDDLVMEAKRFFGHALDYSYHVEASKQHTRAVVDMLQKVYIHLSALYLGLSLTGSLAPAHSVSAHDVSSADNCLQWVSQLEHKGHKLSPSRKVQFHFVHSGLFLRRYQLSVHKDTTESDNLKLSFQNCDIALKLAKDNNLKEMTGYCDQLRQRILEIISPDRAADSGIVKHVTTND